MICGYNCRECVVRAVTRVLIIYASKQSVSNDVVVWYTWSSHIHFVWKYHKIIFNIKYTAPCQGSGITVLFIIIT